VADKNNGGIAALIRQAGKEAKLKAQQILDDEAADLLAQMNGAPLPSATPARKKSRIFNILEYIESEWGLGMSLFPVQRFLVKLYYFLPLDDRHKTIEVTDMLKTRVLHRFTEAEYLRFLYNEGRCNIGEQDHERRELILAIGRRAGKTTLSGIFASYEVYRLLNLHHPQGYYGLPPGNRIQIISVATDKDQAGLLFNEVTAHLARCEYFKPYIASNTQSDIKFRTPGDIDRFGSITRFENGKFQSLNGKATLRVTFKSCVAKGLRGSGNIVIILDEMAHFQDEGQSSAKQIYDAISPSTAAFSPKDPDDPSKPIGEVESRIICISSPLNKTGKFYELFHNAMRGGEGSEKKLAIQAPTWEVNPTISPDYYREKYHEDPTSFATEHGAQFSERVRGWIEREADLMECINLDQRPILLGAPRYPHQLGLDIGVVSGGDGTSVSITYADNDKIVLAYHELWQAGVDWCDSNPHLGREYSCDYARRIKDVDRLDFDEIADWLIGLTKRFYITDGLFDRWQGMPLEQTLIKRGYPQFRSEFFTRDVTSKMFQAVKMLMWDRRLSLYDFPSTSNGSQVKHSPLIAELLSLQAESFSRNVTVVGAPDHAGYHDDMSDALIRAIWLTSEKMGNTKHVYGPSVNQQTAGPSLHGFQMSRARHHGVFTERLNPRSKSMGRFTRGRVR
jgi:hypothetical protein